MGCGLLQEAVHLLLVSADRCGLYCCFRRVATFFAFHNPWNPVSSLPRRVETRHDSNPDADSMFSPKIDRRFQVEAAPKINVFPHGFFLTVQCGSVRFYPNAHRRPARLSLDRNRTARNRGVIKERKSSHHRTTSKSSKIKITTEQHRSTLGEIITENMVPSIGSDLLRCGYGTVRF